MVNTTKMAHFSTAAGLKQHFPFSFFADYVATANYPPLMKFSEHNFTCITYCIVL